MNETDAPRPSNAPIPPIGLAIFYVAALVVIVAGMRTANTIVVSFLLATFIAILFAPILKALERRMPFFVAYPLVLLGILSIGMTVPLVVGASLVQLIGDLPTYQERLQDLESGLSDRLAGAGLGLTPDTIDSLLDPKLVTGSFGSFLNELLQVLGDTAIVLILVAFMLTEVVWWPLKLSKISAGDSRVMDRLDEIVFNVRRYVAVKTCVSLGVGITIWIVLALLGVKYAFAWGFLAYLLDYVPAVGEFFAGIPPILLVAIDQGILMALALALIYLVVNQVFGSVIEPKAHGTGLGLSPLVVFISLIFWGWVLGPVGMLLAAPLTVIARISLNHFDETRWVAILLGGKPEHLADTDPSKLDGAEPA